jgi:hypothetical protein
MLCFHNRTSLSLSLSLVGRYDSDIDRLFAKQSIDVGNRSRDSQTARFNHSSTRKKTKSVSVNPRCLRAKDYYDNELNQARVRESDAERRALISRQRIDIVEK